MSIRKLGDLQFQYGLFQDRFQRNRQEDHRDSLWAGLFQELLSKIDQDFARRSFLEIVETLYELVEDDYWSYIRNPRVKWVPGVGYWWVWDVIRDYGRDREEAEKIHGKVVSFDTNSQGERTDPFGPVTVCKPYLAEELARVTGVELTKLERWVEALCRYLETEVERSMAEYERRRSAEDGEDRDWDIRWRAVAYARRQSVLRVAEALFQIQQGVLEPTFE